MGNRYDGDMLAWATEQAAHLRKRNWSALDVNNLAEEIDDVGRSIRREFKSRTADLLAATPSLRPDLSDEKWLHSVWEGAVSVAHKDTGFDDFPEDCPWSVDEVFDSSFFPD